MAMSKRAALVVVAGSLAAAGFAAFVTYTYTHGHGNSVASRIAAQYHRHHHTVIMSCPSYVTPACDGARFELANSGSPNVVVWEQSFRILPGQSVSFTFTGLYDTQSQALDLAKPNLRCKYGKALTGIPSTVTALPDDTVRIDLVDGSTVTGGPISPQTFTSSGTYYMTFFCT